MSTGDEGEPSAVAGYGRLLDDIVGLLADARSAAVRQVNQVMTTTYWQIGRRIVEVEQSGQQPAAYGEALLSRLSADLTQRFGRGFSPRNLRQFRQFYLTWEPEEIRQTVSAESGEPTAAGEPTSIEVAATPVVFPLPWSAYVRLLAVETPEARSAGSASRWLRVTTSMGTMAASMSHRHSPSR